MPAIPDLPDPLSDSHAGIRLAAERDIPEVLIAHQEDPELAAALGLERAPSGAQLGRAMDEAPVLRSAGAAVTLTVVEPASDDCRGQVHVDRFDWEHAHANVAMWIAPEARGRGLGAHGLKLASDWLIAACGLVRVQFLVASGNEPAIRAALAAGFAREGVLRAFARAREGRVDVTVLSRVASELARR